MSSKKVGLDISLLLSSSAVSFSVGIKVVGRREVGGALVGLALGLPGVTVGPTVVGGPVVGLAVVGADVGGNLSMGRVKMLPSVSDSSAGVLLSSSSKMKIPRTFEVGAALGGLICGGGGSMLEFPVPYSLPVSPPHCPNTQTVPTINAVTLQRIINPATTVTPLQAEVRRASGSSILLRLNPSSLLIECSFPSSFQKILSGPRDTC